MFASPMMTWRRRKRSGSAWGSSLVFTMGRFSVVSRPTSTSKKSARWLIWNGTSAMSNSLPTRPAPTRICREMKKGVIWRTSSPKGVARSTT
jgi:hypothetical protein